LLLAGDALVGGEGAGGGKLWHRSTGAGGGAGASGRGLGEEGGGAEEKQDEPAGVRAEVHEQQATIS
jgi:hypothetical protein